MKQSELTEGMTPLVKKVKISNRCSHLHCEHCLDVRNFDQDNVLPSTQVLMSRLKIFEHTLDTSELVSTIGGKRMSILSVIFYVDLALYDHLEMLRTKQRTSEEIIADHSAVEYNRFLLLKLIFANYPDVIEEIAKTGYGKQSVRGK